MKYHPAKQWRFLPVLILGLGVTMLACNLLSSVAPAATPTNTAPAAGGVTPTGAGAAHTPAASGLTPGAATPTRPAPAGTPSAGGPTANAPTPAISQSGDITLTRNVTFGPGLFNLPDLRVGLADLSSYTATLTVGFDGTVNGQPAKWSRTYVMLASKAPAARQLTIESTGDVSATEPVYLAELDGADYEQRGQRLCTASPIEAGQALGDRLEPAGFLNFVAGADEAGSATVNGVAAQHDTFDERALGQQGVSQSSGELWVAAKGGYLVKYLLTSKGSASYFGDGIAGTLTQDYELTDVGQAVTVQLPAGCPGGMITAPQLPGATNVANTPGVLSYDTTTSVAEAAAFYQKQMADLGWTPPNPPDITPTQAALEFQQGDQDLSIDITTKAGVTTVAMLLVRGQQ